MSCLTRLRSIIRVIRLELSILKHGLQKTSIEQLGLLNHAINHINTGLSRLRLDETHQGDVTLELDISAKIKPLLRRTKLLKSKLRLLRRLNARLVPHNAVLVSHVDTERDINMGLHTPRHIVKTSIKGELSRAYLSQAGDVLDALCDLVPGAVVLVGGGMARSGDGLMRQDEGVEGDDLAVGVKKIDGELSRDEARDGRDDGEGFLLFQHRGLIDLGVSYRVCYVSAARYATISIELQIAK